MELFVQRKKKIQEVHENTPFARAKKAREDVRASVPLHSLEHVKSFLKIVREDENVMVSHSQFLFIIVNSTGVFLQGEVQQLRFTSKFPLNDYKLIQIPKEMLKDVIEGQKLVFRGDMEDSPVLCSESTTFAIKEVETSNTMFLAPTLKTASEVNDSEEKFLSNAPINSLCHHYLELEKVPCVTPFRLRELLHRNELHWDWPSEDSQADTYTRNDLLGHVQMSESEMFALLADMPVVEHSEKLRWLSLELRRKFFTMLIDAFDDDDHPDILITHLTADTLRSCLPENVTDQMISWFLSFMCTKSDTGEYSVNPAPFVHEIASQVLQGPFRRISLKEFEKIMDTTLPCGLKMEPSHLLGISVRSEDIRETFISYLSPEDLPEDTRERLRILFSLQKTWTVEEINPYLRDICADSRAMRILLINLCYSTELPSGEKAFCSLRPV
ncbi:hypothetical protein OESDEN_00467 [Oesophagostomum dentatum]|uniref:Sister chromatid cohesion protein DCC1 n=1 Tax=Oesophagostomum dentatum TaxID=61180 RepID=A0A0B1TTR5_OESDE|nr:hypothetical protein OESDEN_00467 [Oesophagostomum dentatum]